jgi:hypothetical protein
MDDIDFSFIMHKHGWTTFILFVDGQIHEFSISSVFSEPLYDIANTLMALLDNEKSITIKWFDEPGGCILQINRLETERHILSIEVGNFAEGHGPQVIGYEKVAHFRIKQKQFLITALCQLKKNFHLLTDKSFLKNRENAFPYELYKQLIDRLTIMIPELSNQCNTNDSSNSK